MRRLRTLFGAPALIGSLAVLGLTGGSAQAATTTSYHFFSKAVTGGFVDASGNPVGPNVAPVAGDLFSASDNDYIGNHKKHAKAIFASDHIVCTVVTVDTTNFSFTALCDAVVSLPDGMLYADHVMVTFTNKVVVPITGGTGKYTKIKGGTVTSTSYNEKSNNSDFSVTIRR